MRISEYLPWVLVTFASLIFVSPIFSKEWSERTIAIFRISVAIVFFFLIGAYWLLTGEKFDETAYKLILCRVYSFERCASSGEVLRDNGVASENIKKEIEALRKATEELNQRQNEANKRAEEEARKHAELAARAKREAELKQKTEEDAAKARSQEEARAKSAADAEYAREQLALRQKQEQAEKSLAEAELRQRGEEPGDNAMAAALQFTNGGNLKSASEMAERALKIWSALPHANEPYILDKIAAAHSVVGLSLAIMGATPGAQAYGCSRLELARAIYFKTSNAPRQAKIEDDLLTGNCARK